MESVVGIRKDNSEVFESISINNNIETAVIDAETAISKDAEIAGVEVEITQMTSNVLFSYIASNSVD